MCRRYTQTMTRAEVMVVPDVTAAAYDLLENATNEAAARRGRAVVNLSGGSTPLPLYRRLVHASLPWAQLFATWGDERFVPLESAESNAGVAIRTLFDHVPVPAEQVLTWPILANPVAAATSYQRILASAFGQDPVFDVTLLGLGGDGHTASLFPGSGDALRTELTLVTTAPAGMEPSGPRLSMSAAALSRSRLVIFLVAGADKVPALRASFGPAGQARDAASLNAHPARAITALERLVVVTDVAFLTNDT